MYMYMLYMRLCESRKKILFFSTFFQSPFYSWAQLLKEWRVRVIPIATLASMLPTTGHCQQLVYMYSTLYMYFRTIWSWLQSMMGNVLMVSPWSPSFKCSCSLGCHVLIWYLHTLLHCTCTCTGMWCSHWKLGSVWPWCTRLIWAEGSKPCLDYSS